MLHYCYCYYIIVRANYCGYWSWRCIIIIRWPDGGMLKHISHEKIKIQHMSISLILSKSARDKVNKIARCHNISFLELCSLLLCSSLALFLPHFVLLSPISVSSCSSPVFVISSASLFLLTLQAYCTRIFSFFVAWIQTWIRFYNPDTLCTVFDRMLGFEPLTFRL